MEAIEVADETTLLSGDFVAFALHHHPMTLSADPGRVVVRPFNLAWHAAGPATSRAQRLVSRIIALGTDETDLQLQQVYKEFGDRHWHIRKVFRNRFDDVAAHFDGDLQRLSDNQRELIGAYFCHEYSFSSAAIMNPSVTRHPDQSGLPVGSIRFIMSYRAVGEGHISSIAFREGIVTPDRQLQLAPEPPLATAASLHDTEENGDEVVTVFRNEDSTLSGTVLFPVTKAQRNGLEDLRITRFPDDDGGYRWLGTYTAYDGKSIGSELLVTRDFRTFEMMPMRGSASINKGMALFPRKIDGKYAMIGRYDGENLFLLKSDDLRTWDEGQKILEARYPWEFIQIGNCGPPVLLDEGWLLLTHGVGAMRKYAIGAVLLDRDDPSIVMGRTAEPILAAEDEQREGYVPNVVYSCGAIACGSDLFMPYGVADSSIGFAFAKLSDVLKLIS